MTMALSWCMAQSSASLIVLHAVYSRQMAKSTRTSAADISSLDT